MEQRRERGLQSRKEERKYRIVPGSWKTACLQEWFLERKGKDKTLIGRKIKMVGGWGKQEAEVAGPKVGNIDEGKQPRLGEKGKKKEKGSTF